MYTSLFLLLAELARIVLSVDLCPAVAAECDCYGSSRLYCVDYVGNAIPTFNESSTLFAEVSGEIKCNVM